MASSVTQIPAVTKRKSKNQALQPILGKSRSILLFHQGAILRFGGIFRHFWPQLALEKERKKIDHQVVCWYCNERPCQVSLHNWKKQGAKMIPVKSIFFPRVPKSSIHWSSTLEGVSYNTLVLLAEQNKWHGPLALGHAIMSTRPVSNNSAYWPIYGRDTNYIPPE